jgi:hypothetical protein
VCCGDPVWETGNPVWWIGDPPCFFQQRAAIKAPTPHPRHSRPYATERLPKGFHEKPTPESRQGSPTSQDVPLPCGALSIDAGEVSTGCCAISLARRAGLGTVETMGTGGHVPGGGSGRGTAASGGMSLCDELAGGEL